MRISEDLDLTYCTNIHPAHGWDEVLRSLSHHSLGLKKRLSPDQPFGIGLRLSDQETRELLDAEKLQKFSSFLKDSGLYVALMNGYVYGEFHGTPVKTGVFSPDWRKEERVLYTIRLAKILEQLLPENANGGISTAPLSYKPWILPGDASAMRTILRNIVRCASELIRIERETGKRIRLEIEPEPDGLLETVAEVTAFFKELLFREGAASLANELGLSKDNACRLICRHVGVCFDACHSAIEYEEPEQALDQLAAAGIEVGRIQLSSALALQLPAHDRRNLAGQLLPFADNTYLHQVVEQKRDGSLRRFQDLGEALATIDDPEHREWRIHFHVPLFTAGYGALESTQAHVSKILRYIERRRPTSHLEIETYTWSVSPDALKVDLTDSVEREYRWVMDADWRGECERQ
jgi:sugar phosphate isomerase/epimerase